MVDRRTWFYFGLRAFVLVTMGWLWVNVARLTIVEGRFYKSRARDNRIEEMEIQAVRGKIVDRKGRELVKSVYSYYQTNEQGNKTYLGSGDFAGFRFEGKGKSYELKRKYMLGEAMGGMSGYLGRVNAEEMKKGEICRDKVGGEMLVGRGGIEEGMDCWLRGKEGKRLVEVDAKGGYVRELGWAEPEAGKELKLSIDAYWQERGYRLISGKKAAMVVSRPKDGEVVVLASSPGFDPNVFSFEPDGVEINKYLADQKGLPMLNRAIGGLYHPGSVFKIVVAAAGLETGAVNRGTLIEDSGVIKVGDYSYANWLWNRGGGTEGMVDMVKAIRRSNDIYFYRLGEKLGSKNIKNFSYKFGYGQKTGIEIPGELSGLVPDEDWKWEAKREKWFLGNTYHLAIGQGDLAVTPIQVNRATNIVASRGLNCGLTLLAGKADGGCLRVGVSKETFTTIIEGMKQACLKGGTAWPLFNFKTEIGCKTGTAEVGDGSKDSHAWLTAFAPIEDPEISITVMVERGGEGSDVAAPIVGDFLKEWFSEVEKDTVVPRRTE